MIDLNGKLGLHARFRHRVETVGRDGVRVLVIDDFLNAPELMVAHAVEQGRFEGVSDAFYPGLRAILPQIYMFAVQSFLTKIICAAFDLGNSEIVRGSCGYALVTTPPERLNPVQRMPHFDGTDPRQLAFVHYLCGADKGGTAFYRHRATGFELIDPRRAPAYTRAIAGELQTTPRPARYMSGDDALFEQTVSFDAAFNRMLIYRGGVLHSANIAPGFDFDSNPQTGRLTANAFLTFR